MFYKIILWTEKCSSSSAFRDLNITFYVKLLYWHLLKICTKYFILEHHSNVVFDIVIRPVFIPSSYNEFLNNECSDFNRLKNEHLSLSLYTLSSRADRSYTFDIFLSVIFNVIIIDVDNIFRM